MLADLVSNPSSGNLFRNEYEVKFSDLIHFPEREEALFGPKVTATARFVLFFQTTQPVRPNVAGIVKKWNTDLHEEWKNNLYQPQQMKKLQKVATIINSHFHKMKEAMQERDLSLETVNTISNELEKILEDIAASSLCVIEDFCLAKGANSSDPQRIIKVDLRQALLSQGKSPEQVNKMCAEIEKLIAQLPAGSSSFPLSSDAIKMPLIPGERGSNISSSPSSLSPSPPGGSSYEGSPVVSRKGSNINALNLSPRGSDTSLELRTPPPSPQSQHALTPQAEHALRKQMVEVTKEMLKEEKDITLHKTRMVKYKEYHTEETKGALKEGYEHLDEPTEIKALGQLLDDRQAIFLVNQTVKQYHDEDQGKENVSSKLMFLLGSLSPPVFLSLLQSFETADLAHLKLLNELLHKHITVVAVDGRKSIVYPNMPVRPEGVEIDISSNEKMWFCKKLEPLIKELENKTQGHYKRVLEFGSLFKDKIPHHKITYKELEALSELEGEIQLNAQRIMNLKFLVEGIYTKEKLEALEKLNLHLKSCFEWLPASLSSSTRLGLLEKAKKTQEELRKIKKDVLEKAVHQDIGKKLETASGLNSAVLQVLGGHPNQDAIFIRIEEEAFLAYDFADTAYECLTNWGVLDVYEERVESGILVNVPEEERLKWKNNKDLGISKLNKIIEHNLKLVGLTTHRELKSKRIFNKELVRHFFHTPQVVESLKAFPFLSEPSKTLEFLDLYWVTDYKECGLLDNVTNIDYEKLRSQPLVLFDVAKVNLQKLKLTSQNLIRDKGISSKEDLKNYLRTEEAAEYFAKNPYKNYHFTPARSPQKKS